MIEGRSVFHESYYEHSCAVLSEKDVLYTDIDGQKWIAAVRRWWYNLFLLSYNDERCRIYYTSSQAMRLERTRHFRRYRNRIHPLSIFSNFWNCFISVVVILNRIIFRHTTSIVLHSLPIPLYLTGVFLEAIMLFDLVINFQTAYIDKEARIIVLNAKTGHVRYASTKLFAHVAAAMPLQSILMLRYGLSVDCVQCKANRFVCVLRLLGLFSWYRVYDSSAHWARDRSSFRVTYIFKFLRIGVVGLITMMQFQGLADTITILIMISKAELPETSNLAMLIRLQYDVDQPSRIKYISAEFSRMVKSLFLFGYGLKPKVYYLDILFGLIGFLLANIFYTWSLLECYAVINRSKYSEDQLEIHKDRTKNLLRSRQLSDRLCSKVMDYHHFNICRLVIMEKANDLYQFLPSSLIREIRLSCYSRFVRRIPYFSEWPMKIVEDLVMMLKEEVFLQHDLIFDAWCEGEGLVIVNTGVLAVYTYNQEETGHLIDGDYFGELSLVTDKEVRTSYVVAVSRCKLLFLHKNDFRRYMRQYPGMFFEMRAQLREKYLADRQHEAEEAPAPQAQESPTDMANVFSDYKTLKGTRPYLGSPSGSIENVTIHSSQKSSGHGNSKSDSRIDKSRDGNGKNGGSKAGSSKDDPKEGR